MEEKQNFSPAKNQNIALTRKTIAKSKSIKNLKKPTFHDQAVNQFVDYISDFDHKIDHVNQGQLQKLKKKYRFYLNIIDKLQNQKSLLQQKLQNFDSLVDNSHTIMQSKANIQFIQMILVQTNENLEALSKKLNLAKNQKKSSEVNILKLKDIIRREKDKFFKLKREELMINTDLQQIEKKHQLGVAQNRFKSILASKVQTTRNHSKKPTMKFNNLSQTPIEQNVTGYQSPSSPARKSKHKKNISVQAPEIDNSYGQITNSQKKLVTLKQLREHKVSIYIKDPKNASLSEDSQPYLPSQLKLSNKQQSTVMRQILDQQNSGQNQSVKITPVLSNKTPNQCKIISKPNKDYRKSKMALAVQLKKMGQLRDQLQAILKQQCIKQIWEQKKTYADITLNNETRYLKQNKQISSTTSKFWKNQKSVMDEWKNLSKYSIKKRLKIMNNNSKNALLDKKNKQSVLPQIKPLQNGRLSYKIDVSDTNILVVNRDLEKITKDHQNADNFMKLSVRDIVSIIANSDKIAQIVSMIEKECISPDVTRKWLQV